MIEDIEKVIFKRMESIYQDDSYKDAKFNNFCVPDFQSEKPNTMMDSRMACHK